MLDDVLDRLRCLRADRVLDLSDDLPCSRLPPEEQAGNGNGNDNERRHGEDGVVGKGSSEPRRFVLTPALEGFLQQIACFLEVHFAFRLPDGSYPPARAAETP